MDSNKEQFLNSAAWYTARFLEGVFFFIGIQLVTLMFVVLSGIQQTQNEIPSIVVITVVSLAVDFCNKKYFTQITDSYFYRNRFFYYFLVGVIFLLVSEFLFIEFKGVPFTAIPLFFSAFFGVFYKLLIEPLILPQEIAPSPAPEPQATHHTETPPKGSIFIGKLRK